MVEEIIKQTTGDLSGLINFTGGGESLSPEREAELNQFLKEHNVPEYVKFCSGYGMSEVASSTCANSNKLYKKDSLGLPLPKTNVKIVDEDSGKELPLGEVGEICFCTPCAMLGYYKNEEATRAMIEVDENGDRWVHTGDLGCMDEDGFLFFKGKLKRIYICITPENGAMKFFPARVEDLVNTDPGVERCGVIALPHPKRGHVPAVFLTRPEGSSESEEELIALSELDRDLYYSDIKGFKGTEDIKTITVSDGGGGTEVKEVEIYYYFEVGDDYSALAIAEIDTEKIIY